MNTEMSPRTRHSLAPVREILDRLAAVALTRPTDPPVEALPPPAPASVLVRGTDPARPEVYAVEFAAGHKRLVLCPCRLARAGGRWRVREQAVVDGIPDGPPIPCAKAPSV